MKCVTIVRHGPPEAMRVEEKMTPTPVVGEILVRVRAAGINYADILARIGLYQDAPRLPFVPGYEVSGVVEALGPGVAGGFKVGDRVMAFTRFGGYASHAVARDAHVRKLPAAWSFEEGAAFPVAALTSWHALMNLGALKPYERVLIHAAAGGVGSFAVQIARHVGAKVYGIAGGAEKCKWLREHGVDEAIDHTATPWAEEVERLTGGKGVHLVLDANGGASYVQSYRLLAPGGRLIMYGIADVTPAGGRKRSVIRALGTLARMPKFSAVKLMTENRGVLGFNLLPLGADLALMEHSFGGLTQLVDAGHLRPEVGATFPLERAADAHELISSRKSHGKVLLTIAGTA
jgi:NADPH:quinone reductase-like Zn-dependent oxidoreductase